MDKKFDVLKFLLYLCLSLGYIGLLGGTVLAIITNFISLSQGTIYTIVGFLLIGEICGIAAGVLNIWR